MGVVCIVLGTSAVARAQSPVDSFDPGANGAVNAVAVQSDGKILVGGSFTTLGGGGTGTTPRLFLGRLNVDGSVDTAFNPGANADVRTVAVQPDGKILVAGAFTMLGGGIGTTPRNFIGRLNPDGSIDTTFNPGANAAINVVVVQADGKILAGGQFTMLGGGGTGTTPRSHIGRLNADGSLDTSFDPGANGDVGTIVVQPRGAILLGGLFTGLGAGTGATTRNHVGRLNADGSLDTSFDPGANDTVWALALQADGKILLGGQFTMLGGGGTGTTARSHIGRLNADGSLDGPFNPGADLTVFTIAVQPDGKIVLGGTFTTLGGGGTGTTPRNQIGRLRADGSLDAGFDPGADHVVFALAVQPDEKILVGGNFTTLGGGGTGTTTRNRIGRLYADGSLETSFNPGANDEVLALAVQPDGKILVGGFLTTLGGGGTGTTTRNRLGRLNADGSLDASFDPGANGLVETFALQPDGKIVVGGNFTTLGGGGTGTTEHVRIGRLNADGSLDPSVAINVGQDNVSVVAVQPDGKIVVAGNFDAVGPGLGHDFFRLNADGSLDSSFNPGANFDGVFTLALQPDGKIVVGGNFSMLGAGGTGTTPRNKIGRLNADGSLDTSFDPGANDNVSSLAVQPDGKILVGGSFTMLGGGGTGTTPRNFLGRLNADGSVDASFDPGANDIVWSFALQSDGKIVVGGSFTTLGGGGTGTTTRNRIGRFNADGSLDASFNPGANDRVYAVALQPDGKILVNGLFTGLGGGTGTTTRNRIGRLTNTGAASQSLSVTGDGSVVTWLRSGAGPEVWRATFESSTDGVTYTPLGNGTRVAGGWQLTGQSVPTNQSLYLRARGYSTTGRSDDSGSILESIRNVYASCSTITLSATTFPSAKVGVAYPPTTLTQTGGAGTTTFAVTGGALPSGLSLSSGGTVSGTPTVTGTFNFTVTATDANSCTGSRAYTLTIVTYQPFTDDVLTAGSSVIRAVHITELRTRIDAQRARFGLPGFAWTDESLSGVTVKAIHLNELRAAIVEAYQAGGRTAPTFTDPTLQAGVTVIRAVHVQELRAAVISLEGS